MSRLHATRLGLGAIALAGLLLGPAPAGAQPLPCSVASLQGAWAQEGGPVRIRFEADRVVILRKDGDLRAATILGREPCKLTVRDNGLRSNWTIKGDAHALLLDLGSSSPPLNLVPLSAAPAELDINPVPLPPLGPVP